MHIRELASENRKLEKIAKVKIPRVLFVVGVILLLSSAVNWYFYFNPTGHRTSNEPLEFNFDTIMGLITIIVFLFLAAKVGNSLGRIFWGLGVLSILTRFGWNAALVNGSVENYELASAFHLTLLATGFLIFSFLEQRRGESVFAIKKKESA